MKRERDADYLEDLYAQVDAYGLVPNLRACLACGKCVGGCPVASISPSYNPRQIIRDVLAGTAERFLDSEEIWRCFWCANCFMGCPSDIHFPLLMMQIRYRAIERRYGLKYFMPFKKFALRARDDGLTFVPSPKNRERIMKLRESMGMTPWPEVSDGARVEYRALFDLTGTTAHLEAVEEDAEKPVRLAYLEGRITGD
jgi:heterodisulfide reductase subunit C